MISKLSPKLADKKFEKMTGSEVVELFAHIFSVQQPPTETDEIVVGMSELARVLGCGRTKAQELKNAGLLDGAVFQEGRKVYTNVNKLQTLRQQKKFAL